VYFLDVPTADWPSGVDTRYDRRGWEASPENVSESSPSTERDGAAGVTGDRACTKARVLGKRPVSERPPSPVEMSAWASHHEGPVKAGYRANVVFFELF
jgi:hypothetical protein